MPKKVLTKAKTPHTALGTLMMSHLVNSRKKSKYKIS